MTLADIFPKGYLVAQAWRKWFNTDKPPFCHHEELDKWGDRWFALVQHEAPQVERAYNSFATAVLGFLDDPQRAPLPSHTLWQNADNAVLQEIAADRQGIAKALGVGELNAGIFVLTGWLWKANFKQVMRKLVEFNREPSQFQIPEEIAEVINDPLWHPAIYAEWLLVTVHEIQIAEVLGTDAQKQDCPTADDAPAVKPAAAVQGPEAGEPTKKRMGHPTLEEWFERLIPEEVAHEKANAEKYITLQASTTKDLAAKAVKSTRRTMERRVELLKNRGVLGVNSGQIGN